ncbi:ClpP/crotonase [Wolfiporia cocos MD-104 SS10]|uniref:ClpP/crotonase n=1 Tax=Wolfiporia cocos (strain MD-104) TaxID=742152 RepID=A0A2H3ISR2_WOLCO|nr:ClpP/crotonase [Wolfiporia cocos MD-104 SS10]
MSEIIAALSSQFIQVSLPEPHAALVELNRKPVNAFSQEFWTELGHTFDKIGREPSIRVVVLASALPKAFTAGIDLSALATLDTYEKEPDKNALQQRDFLAAFQRSISSIERCPYPVIAAVHGVAYGLAVDIIAACDVRYAASNASFSIKEVDIGLAADIGTLARLPKLAGNLSLVHELAYTARAFGPAEALQMGMVSRVVEGGRNEVVHAALSTAKEIAQKSPIAVLGTKHLLLHARDHSVQENLDYTTVWNGVMLQTADIKESLAAVKAKRKPQYATLGKLPSKL